ncbi:MAG: hypothetical protein KDD12_02925, partial [Lewinella sp.]|nr:hypothetical protein [Lewinella sp.]
SVSADAGSTPLKMDGMYLNRRYKISFAGPTGRGLTSLPGSYGFGDPGGPLSKKGDCSKQCFRAKTQRSDF